MEYPEALNCIIGIPLYVVTADKIPSNDGCSIHLFGAYVDREDANSRMEEVLAGSLNMPWHDMVRVDKVFLNEPCEKYLGGFMV